MRFLRWYGRLAKEAFSNKKSEHKSTSSIFGDIKSELTHIIHILKWYLVNMGLFTVLAIAWMILPEAIKGYISGMASVCWYYISGFVSAIWVGIKTALDWLYGASYLIWTKIRPIYEWFNGVNWSDIGGRIDYGFKLFFIAMLHLSIALYTVTFGLIVMFLFINLARLALGHVNPQKEGPIVKATCLAVAVYLGYCVTTSHYGVVAVNYLVSLMVS